MPYRITLCGFNEAVRQSIQFSLEFPAVDARGYTIVEHLHESDFSIVDAESPTALKAVSEHNRIARAVFIGEGGPPEATVVLPRPIDLPRILRAVALLVARHGVDPRSTANSAAADDPDEIIVFEPQMWTESLDLPTLPEQLPVIPTLERAGRPAMPASLNLDDIPKLHRVVAKEEPPLVEPVPFVVTPDKKVAAKRAARRARQSHVHTDPGRLEQLRDVLVLDTDNDAIEKLRELLEMFGFRVHVARNIAQAADALSRHALVAAFLDVPLNGADQGDGVALLQTIQDLPRLVGNPAPPVLLVSTQLRPSDRVRAQLAGVSVQLVKPVTRGDVARALESCDVLLPADARRTM